MHWRLWLKRFGWRLVICLVIIGLGYILVVLQPWQDKAITPAQKIANIRAALSQGYVAGTDISSFNDSTPVAGYDLATLQAVLSSSTQQLESALRDAPDQLTPLKAKLEEIVGRQRKANQAYATAYGVFDKVVQYDPEKDLGRLDANKDRDELTKRATAAQNGLQTTAESSTTIAANSSLSVESNDLSSLVTPKTKQRLLDQAYCFQRVAEAPLESIQSLRSQCIDTYPDTRHQAIRNIIDQSYNQDYQRFIKARVPPLLEALEHLANER